MADVDEQTILIERKTMRVIQICNGVRRAYKLNAGGMKSVHKSIDTCCFWIQRI